MCPRLDRDVADRIAVQVARAVAVALPDGRAYSDDCKRESMCLRPCPVVWCRYHLWIDRAAGLVQYARAGTDTADLIERMVNLFMREPWHAEVESCALDCASRGPLTLEEVGVVLGVTRERVRQLESRGLSKLRNVGGIGALQPGARTIDQARAVCADPDKRCAFAGCVDAAGPSGYCRSHAAATAARRSWLRRRGQDGAKVAHGGSRG